MTVTDPPSGHVPESNVSFLSRASSKLRLWSIVHRRGGTFINSSWHCNAVALLLARPRALVTSGTTFPATDWPAGRWPLKTASQIALNTRLDSSASDILLVRGTAWYDPMNP